MMEQSPEILGEGLEGDALNRAIFAALHPNWIDRVGYFNDGHGHAHLVPDFVKSVDVVVDHIPDEYAFGSQGWFINKGGSRLFPFWIHDRPDAPLGESFDGCHWIGYGYTRRTAAARALLNMARGLLERKETPDVETP